jgi:hypothetical protein
MRKREEERGGEKKEEEETGKKGKGTKELTDKSAPGLVAEY